MEEINLSLERELGVELQEIEVGVDGDVIALDVAGVIRGVDDAVLASAAGKSLRPTTITFDVAET